MPEAKIDQLTDHMRQRILAGEFGTQGRLPPHRELADQLGTSRESTNKVLQHLIAEGLLLSQGRSVYVAPPRVRLPALISHYHRYMQDQGLFPISAFIDIPCTLAASADLAQQMRVAEGTLVVHRCLKQGIQRGAESMWYRLLENVFPATCIGETILRAMQIDPAFDVLQAVREASGKTVAKVENQAIARFPTAVEQQHLDIVRATPMMEIQRVQYSGDGEVLALSRLCLIGSLFTLSFTVDVADFGS
ncbi:MAG TPA: GntR family transcriptional regulator [Ktedonosporobacter sp.]|nr:GntR family transcriptional regulator [Ktedonosporobacter sp.]